MLIEKKQVCEICSNHMRENFKKILLSKHSVQFYQCESCGYLKTETPYWLDEAYTESLSKLDTGIMLRNIKNSEKISCFLRFKDENEKYLDFAGGAGIFVRMMRDRGFNFYWSDKYSANIVAKGFEVQPHDKNFKCITMFEVLEHLENPVKFFDELFTKYQFKYLIFSTELIPNTNNKLSDWWYLTPETGQHISFFTKKTLEILANKYGCKFQTRGSYHIFSKENFNRFYFNLCMSRLSKLISLLFNFKSLINQDAEKLKTR